MKVRFSSIEMFFFHSVNVLRSITAVKNKNEIELCSSFWTGVMSKVIEQIQQSNDVAALKSICCDALSNIGSHIFERLEV